jgi:hypothetical protein
MCRETSIVAAPSNPLDPERSPALSVRRRSDQAGRVRRQPSSARTHQGLPVRLAVSHQVIFIAIQGTNRGPGRPETPIIAIQGSCRVLHCAGMGIELDHGIRAFGLGRKAVALGKYRLGPENRNGARRLARVRGKRTSSPRLRGVLPALIGWFKSVLFPVQGGHFPAQQRPESRVLQRQIMAFSG